MDQSPIIYLSVDQLKAIIKEAVTEALVAANVKPKQEECADDVFYTRDELCKKFHISDTKLWRLEKAGIIASKKIGRRNLYPRKETDLIVASGQLAKYNRKRASSWRPPALVREIQIPQ